MVQSTYTRIPSSSGAPVLDGDQATPSNLSTPLVAIRVESSCCASANRLTQKKPARCIAGQAREVLAGQNSTSGGDSDADEKDWHVIPTGSPFDEEVTTVTPVQNRPSTSRKCRA